MTTYAVGINKNFIMKDFILSEEEFCAQVTSKLQHISMPHTEWCVCKQRSERVSKSEKQKCIHVKEKDCGKRKIVCFPFLKCFAVITLSIV